MATALDVSRRRTGPTTPVAFGIRPLAGPFAAAVGRQSYRKPIQTAVVVSARYRILVGGRHGAVQNGPARIAAGKFGRRATAAVPRARHQSSVPYASVAASAAAESSSRRRRRISEIAFPASGRQRTKDFDSRDRYTGGVLLALLAR